MTKTGTESAPLIARADAPGPVMVKDLSAALSIVSAVLIVMVAGRTRLKLIVSPLAEASMAARSEPGPLSFVFVTMSVLPNAGATMINPSIATAKQTLYLQV